jgi:NitT/TauT family transport system substrate-binding protein
MTTATRPLRLMETFHNLFYTPIYVAVGGGFLAQQGLDVSLHTAPPSQTAIALLKAGEVDILQTGVSRSFMDLDAGHADAPLHIAAINQRDGFFLVSHTPPAGWTWHDLEGASVIPVGFTPVPWTSLRYAMLAHGVDLAKVRLLTGLSADQALDTFRSGGADYIHMPNPQAEQLVGDGSGHIAVGLGPLLGDICYSSFAVTPAFLAANAELVQRFVTGWHHTLQWIAHSTTAEIVHQVTPFFPETADVVLERSIARYRQQHTWPDTPLIGEDGFTRIREMFIAAGLVQARYPYDRLVRPAFAHHAIALSQEGCP